RSPPRDARPGRARSRLRTSRPGASPSAALRLELGQELVQALHERGRILELPAFCEHGLLEQQKAQALEPAIVALVLEAANERVLRIELEARYRRRRRVPRGLEQLPHLITEIVLVQHETRGGLAQASADSHLVDTLAQDALH